MPDLETFRKQAKLLVRWHREGNFSIGGRIRQLPRYHALTDHDALALPFSLGDAQEIIAREAGHQSWAALKNGLQLVAEQASPGDAAVAAPLPRQNNAAATAQKLVRAIPVLPVSNVEASAQFFRDKLGFTIDFLHGNPPFYGAVCRDGICLHLKFVHGPIFADGARESEGMIMAFIDVENVKGLFAEFIAAGVQFRQTLTKQAWGGTDFYVLDPDGNAIAFVG